MKYLFLFLLISNLSFAQINTQSNYKKYISDETAEKVIVHTDRALYLSGEKMWFKAYCSTPSKTEQINLSNVLYIELYNSSRELIVKRKFNVENGITYGSIDIPYEFLSGTYYLRAYTQFLKNYSANNYFTSLITIINPTIALSGEVGTTSKSSVEIIPNGGDLIDGIKTQFAFKIAHHLIEQSKQILIVDKDNIIVSTPSIQENGFGIFEITSDQSSNYVLKLMLNNNDSILTSLPQPKDEGIMIKASITSNKKLSVNIFNKNNSSENINQEYRLIVNPSNFKLSLEEKILFVNGRAECEFPVNFLNNGINELIIKDSQNNLIKSCSFFNKNEGVNIEISTSKNIYSQRELAKININSTNLNNINLTDVSVSVVKKGTYNIKNVIPENIIRNPQILNSFLQDPANINTLSQDQIDILMIYFNHISSNITTRNELEKTATNIQWIPEIRNVSISGTVFNKANNIPISNIPVYISAFKESPQIHLYKSQSNGEFIFSLNNLVDHQDVFLCTKPWPGKDIGIRINNDFWHEFPPSKDLPLLIDPSHQVFLEEMYINMQAGEIFKTKTGTNILPEISFPFNFGKPQLTIVVDNYVSTPTLEMFLKEIVPNIRVRKRKNQYSISIYDPLKFIYYDEPLLLVDNIPIFDINELMKIPPSKMEKLEVYYDPLLFGEELINGVIMITTNTIDFGGIKPPKGSVFLEYQTISPAYRFDPPTYNNDKKRTNKIADFRNLLYWNPSVNITSNESISFYTSDHCSEYDVIVRGFTDDGKYCFGKTSINVVSNK